MRSASADSRPSDRNAGRERCGVRWQTVWRGWQAHSIRIAVPAFAPPTPRRQHCTHRASWEILLSTIDHSDRSRLLSAERHPVIPLEQSTFSASRFLLARYCLHHVPAPRPPPPTRATARTAARPRALGCRGNHRHRQREIEDLRHETRHVPQEGSRIRPAAAWDPQFQLADHAPGGVSSTVAPTCQDLRQQTSQMSVPVADAGVRHRSRAVDPKKRLQCADSILLPYRTRTQRLPSPHRHGRTRCPICLRQEAVANLRIRRWSWSRSTKLLDCRGNRTDQIRQRFGTRKPTALYPITI